MPIPLYRSRASRDYEFVPGQGGYVRVDQYTPQGVLTSPIAFDVGLWLVEHIFINQETGHSGLAGGPGRTRVGSDWNFAAQVPFPAAGHIIAPGSPIVQPEELPVEFVQTLLGSSRGVYMTFNVGDPDFWTDRGLPVRSMRGRALLDSVKIDNQSNPPQTAAINVIGSGKGLLWTFLGDTAQHPAVWF